PSETVSYVYDGLGRLVTETSSVRGVTTYQYDQEGRRTQVASPEGSINYEYDSLGRQTRMYTGTSASPIDDVRYSYDALSRLASVTVWEQNGVLTPANSRPTTAYQYDLLGNVRRVTLPNGIISVYGYDMLNRSVSVTHYLPGGAELAEYDY